VRRVKAAMDGSWKSQQSWDGMTEGTVKMAPFTNMPDDVKKMAEDTVAAISAGKLDPFGGKITKQDGTVVDKVDDGMILGMNWYVKGIDDKLPQ
jgi:simple sugar transport system substrate-binding protein